MTTSKVYMFVKLSIVFWVYVTIIYMYMFLCIQTLKLRQQLSSSKKHLGELKKQDMETPEQEQERLLQQVKNDNQEIASLEKR